MLKPDKQICGKCFTTPFDECTLASSVYNVYGLLSREYTFIRFIKGLIEDMLLNPEDYTEGSIVTDIEGNHYARLSNDDLMTITGNSPIQIETVIRNCKKQEEIVIKYDGKVPCYRLATSKDNQLKKL